MPKHITTVLYLCTRMIFATSKRWLCICTRRRHTLEGNTRAFLDNIVLLCRSWRGGYDDDAVLRDIYHVSDGF